MPQGVGYGAILRGPDGGPAIDHVTGQPLTMEELLRRQGIIPWYERATPTGQSAGNDVSRPPKPVAGVTFPPSGVGGPTGGAPAQSGAPPSLPESGVTAPASDSSPAALADDPEVQASVASLDPPEQSMFWKMVLAGTGGTALAAWLANRLMRKGTPVPPKVAQTAAAPISVPIPGAGGPPLGSPQTMTVRPVQSNNIRLPAISTGPTIVPTPALPTVEPPLDDGVKRTLGRQVPPRSRAAKALARARR